MDVYNVMMVKKLKIKESPDKLNLNLDYYNSNHNNKMELMLQDLVKEVQIPMLDHKITKLIKIMLILEEIQAQIEEFQEENH